VVLEPLVGVGHRRGGIERTGHEAPVSTRTRPETHLARSVANRRSKAGRAAGGAVAMCSLGQAMLAVATGWFREVTTPGICSSVMANSS
jgi:hypothetical protein